MRVLWPLCILGVGVQSSRVRIWLLPHTPGARMEWGGLIRPAVVRARVFTKRFAASSPSFFRLIVDPASPQILTFSCTYKTSPSGASLQLGWDIENDLIERSTGREYTETNPIKETMVIARGEAAGNGTGHQTITDLCVCSI